MLLSLRTRSLFASFAIFFLLMVGAGCKGFFVNPTVSTVTVSPATNNLQVSATRQLSAIATYSDGSTKDVTGIAIWDTSDPTLVSVSKSGVIQALQTTSTNVTITATYKVSGQATVTVGNSTLSVTSSLGTSISLAAHPAGTPITFTATQNGSDVTSASSFTTSNSNVISLTGTSNKGQVAGQGTATITANDGGAAGSVQITVGP